jgi:hypothetical protein
MAAPNTGSAIPRVYRILCSSGIPFAESAWLKPLDEEKERQADRKKHHDREYSREQEQVPELIHLKFKHTCAFSSDDFLNTNPSFRYRMFKAN